MNFAATQIKIHTDNDISVHDLNPLVLDYLHQSGVQNGLLTVTSHHTTTALIVNEYESRLLVDIQQYLKHIVPRDQKYLHNDIHLRDCPQDEPENAHSHLMAMLLSHSVSVPISDGRCIMGQYQSIMLIELDGPRERYVDVHIMGV